MPVDESFKKPGAIPFQWEIRPGVPKIQTHQNQPPKKLSPPSLPSPSPPFTHCRSPPVQKHPKLKPPPAGFIFLPAQEPRTRSLRSDPKARSERYGSDQPTRLRPESVSPGCFPSPLLKRKESKRRIKVDLVPGPGFDYGSEFETPPRFSFSSRKSVSPFRDSSASSSFSSYGSSPRVVGDVEWAGFGLF